MKNINILSKLHKVFFATVIFLFTFVISCSDLEENPPSLLVPDNFFSSATDVEAGVSAAFSKYHAAIVTPQTFLTQMGSDDLTTHKASNKQPFREFDGFNASAGNVWMANRKWDPLWKAILAANATINGWQNIVDTDEVIETEVKPVAAMAYFIRALTYFDLVRIWGDLPLITGETTGKETRNSVQEVYDLIYQDLAFAEAYLPNEWTDGSTIGKPSKMAAKALLARVALTNAGWPLKDNSKFQLAADKAKEVMDSGNFSLEPNFSDLWVEQNGNLNEGIFVIRMCDPCANVPGAWAAGAKTNFYKVGFAAAENGGGFEDILVEINFFNDFPAGPRKDATYYDNVNGTPWQDLASGRPLIAKYGPNLGSIWDNTNQDVYISRYADILLIYAEASNKASGNPSTGAYDAINEVRARAELAPIVGLSSEEFHKAVIAERGWEFTAEYIHRWFDLIRNEMVEEVSENRNPDEVGFGNVITKDKYIAPIPIADITLNPNLTQNPGY
ncbi:MAG: RagB/SusD family nutrient uptake outer membrane protein [Flavobacteriaceae bacterium]|nr:RagB/SusD family nutrient uptake outer membrane protein [Flavobacteriaceae bacterium]